MDDLDAPSALSAAWQRREHLREAMGELEAALAAPVPGRLDEWWSDVRGALVELGDVWGRHIAAVEEPDGLFAEVMDQAPRLAHAVDRLRRDHDAIAADVAALAARSPTGGDAEAVRATGLDLLRHLAHHRHLGADLLHEAYAVDVTAGD